MYFKDPMEEERYFTPCEGCGCEIQAGEYTYEIFDEDNRPKLVCEGCLRDYLRDVAATWGASEIADLLDLDRAMVTDPRERLNSLYYQEEY